jgi:hypothetical protein
VATRFWFEPTVVIMVVKSSEVSVVVMVSISVAVVSIVVTPTFRGSEKFATGGCERYEEAPTK